MRSLPIDMRKKLLDILACPIDKYYPLELFEFVTQEDKVIQGLLFCRKCERYYPIMDEIPVMLPDELRNKQEDISFLEKWKEKLPSEILEKGKPCNLKG
jgi:uncharacterized protein YbaR (Trm112 family)